MDMEDADREDQQQQQQQQQQKRERVPVGQYTKSSGKTVAEHERARPTKRTKDDEDGDQEQADKERDAPAAAATTSTRPPKMTVEEFLRYDLKQQGEILARKQASDDKTPTAPKDKSATELMEGDRANEERQKAAEEQPKLGYDELVYYIGLLAEDEPDNHDLQSIFLHAKTDKYRPGTGQFGPMSIVPHLQKAGHFDLATRIMNQDFDLTA